MAEDNNTLAEGAKGWAILAAVMFCVFLLFWYYWGTEIKHVFRLFRWGELWLLLQFAEIFPFILDPNYSVSYGDQPVSLRQIVDQGLSIDKTALSPDMVNLFSALAMKPLKWVFVAILAVAAYWSYSSGPGTQFRRRMGLTELIKAQSNVFPVISPFIAFNPSTMPPRPPGAPVPAELPIFAEALGPEEWLAYNQIPIPDGKIDEEALYIAFARQLGPRWKGPNKLPPDKQIFLAACCLRAARKRRESDDLMGRIAQCWSHDKGLRLSLDKTLVKDARAVLRNKEVSGKLLAKINQHAFRTTALVRALDVARSEGGVMAPAQFVWMRAHDRALWYPLNNLGRQTFHMEALGALSHYKIEKRTQRPVAKPKVDDAVRSLVEYMESGRQRPIPVLDYSGSKKRGIKKVKAAQKT